MAEKVKAYTVTQQPRGRKPGLFRLIEANQQLVKEDETVRSAMCPKHEKLSSEYIGVNEHGWIFRCGGYSRREARDYNKAAIVSQKPPDAVANQWHYFGAEPA